MRRRRALLLALIAPACAPARPTAPSPDPPSESPPAALAPGQAPAAASPADVGAAPPEPQVMRVQNMLIGRFGRSEPRRFRDTFGELTAAAPAVFAVPVRAGQCYQVFVSADAAVGDLNVRLLDPAALLEDDGRYGAYAMLGQRRPLCADRGATWRLEVASAQGRGRFVVTVLSRTGPDEAARVGGAGPRVWGGE